jgi:predicted permease
MRPLGGLFLRVRDFVRARRSDQDLRDQISGHLEEAAEEYVQRGLSPAEARRLALLEFGSVVQVEETCRDVRGRWLQDVMKDVGYGVRSLRRDPAFATIAVVSLAAGIGVNTAVFSIVNSILLRPRAVASPDQLVELYSGRRDQPFQTTSYPSYIEFRERNGVFTGLAAYSIRQFKLGDANNVEQVWGEAVSGNYFEVLGVQPRLGRPIAAADELVPGGTAVAVIGHELWQRRFNADPGLIGRTVVINGRALTVVGIAPPQYTGMMRGLASEVWIPVTLFPALEPSRGEGMLSRRSKWLVLLGRLKAEATVEQARARFDVLSREMQASQPDEWRPRRPESGAVEELFVSVVRERDSRLHPGMRTEAYAVAALLIVTVNLVVLIACTNLAGLLLARAVARRREVAIRLALGATRWRIVRQLMTENVLLALAAGAAGIVVTVWLLNALVAWIPALPEGIRIAVDLHLDWRVLAYTIAVSTVTGILFGLLPALESSNPRVPGALKDDSNAVSGGYRKSRSRTALVLIQVALSVLLLIGAGLTLRSLEKLRPTRLGFSSENILLAPLTLEEGRYDRRQSQEFYQQLAERVSSLPGVRAVSFAGGVPGGFTGGSRRTTEIEGYQPGPGESLEIDFDVVSARHFTNMNVPIVQGRDFDERDRDGAPCVAIVNEAFARRYFAAAPSPLGKHLAKFEVEPSPSKEMCEIVGVVRDNQFQSLRKAVQPFYALALGQKQENRMYLLVHTDGDPARLANSLRRTVLALEPGMPVNDVQTLRGYFGASLYPFRVLAIIMAASGGIALVLAMIGIYGIVSHAAAQRTREVGIRMALGALRTDILRMVLSEGMVPVAMGLALGLLLSAASTRVLTSSLFEMELLYGVSSTDALTFASVTVLLALVAAVACYIPARRAATVDPTVALKYE